MARRCGGAQVRLMLERNSVMGVLHPSTKDVDARAVERGKPRPDQVRFRGFWMEWSIIYFDIAACAA